MNSDEARNTGINALKLGDSAGAIQHLSVAVQANPQDAQAFGYLGTAFAQLSRFAEAAECLGRAVRLAPNSAPLRFNLGMALERLDRKEDATEAYRQALAVDPGYARASQALSRLVSQPSAPPVPAPGGGVAPTPPGSSPAPPAAVGIGDFALPGTAPATAPAASPADTTLPAYGGSQASPYGPPPAYGTGASAPTLYDIPAASVSGLQPLGDWTPAPSAAGPQPLGDWTPAPRPPASGPQPGAPHAPQAVENRSDLGTAFIARVEGEGASMSRSTYLGHCYLTGMGMGFWWGLIGAIIAFLGAMVLLRGSQLGAELPRVLTLCLMVLAVGVLAYGLVGLFGGMSDDPESLCQNLGLLIGVPTALLLCLLTWGWILLTVIPFGFGSLWASRMMGKAVGGSIAEHFASVLVVSGASGATLTRGR